MHLRAVVGRGRRHITHEAGVDRIGHVIDHDAADPLERHEGVQLVADLSHIDAFRLRSFVVGTGVEGAAVFAVEERARVGQRSDDLLELATGLAHLDDGAVRVLLKDRDAAPAVGDDLFDLAIAVGVTLDG